MDAVLQCPFAHRIRGLRERSIKEHVAEGAGSDSGLLDHEDRSNNPGRNRRGCGNHYLGYLFGTAIFAVIFVIAVSAQVAARRFHPFLYWAVIVATTTAGTTLADFLDRSLGIGYLGGSIILIAMLLATLGLWAWSTGSVSVNNISSRKAEIFYWATIMFSQTLGTALGDWAADDKTGLGLGYEGGALVFAAGLAAVAAAYRWSRISHTLLFWAAFVLTRPLGATIGDFLDKPVANGGLAMSRYSASAALAVFMIGCLLFMRHRAGRAKHQRQ